MFSAFMNIFFARVLEVDYGAVSDLADEGVVMDGTLVEKFFRQMVYKLVQGFSHFITLLQFV